MTLLEIFRFRRKRQPPAEILRGPDNRDRHFDRESRLYLMALLMQRP